MTLRLRMTLVLVAIVALGLLAADVVTYTMLRSFLTSRVDTELAASVTPIGRSLVDTVYQHVLAWREYGRLAMPSRTQATTSSEWPSP